MRPKGLSFIGLMLRVIRLRFDPPPTPKEHRQIRIEVLDCGAKHPACHCQRIITDDCPVHARCNRVHLSRDL